jgi:hypothetical protein
MTRKRNDAETISLFSFQDIMASVIGMLFFVVILLSLSIVTEVAPAADEPTEQESAKLAERRERADELRQQKIVLETRIASISKKRVQASAIQPNQTIAKLKQLRKNLDAMYETIEEEQERLKSLVRQIKPKEIAIEKKRKELKAVEAKIQESETRLSRAKSKPRLTFIIDKRPDRLKPWLVEITGDGLRVGSQDGQGLVIDFKGKTARERMKLFQEWARNQNQREHYFVLLIKPSGVKHVRNLATIIVSLGFEVGTDLLPEKWKPFR